MQHYSISQYDLCLVVKVKYPLLEYVNVDAPRPNVAYYTQAYHVCTYIYVVMGTRETCYR